MEYTYGLWKGGYASTRAQYRLLPLGNMPCKASDPYSDLTVV
jgi:hypothetical protein